MSLHWFSPPVAVKTSRVGVTYQCNSVEGAAEQLLQWTKRGPKWHSAVQLCMDAMVERVKPELVRRAFLEAAKEEGKLLSS
ncbi:DUF982 domain-containing protein [Mesorhizobium sp. M3A.F.Ca.ET.080.04.2.1]|uniref:DUF982 domain-containing protein n=1 Tax=Mesorhizobium sp. M3A.F.Ca.ET.080.04.2.1 TaxID=2493676 RepID=UPI000F74D75F|nr:DUF982 domain-containing protein [Mesorhizobium sp. M3A.F.Ca.ET.080.04.2.1]AZO09702.1 DUF982 domain-containing protein [Mesorhizobium sp. M3A.F.Ca.ET.080.04.2.1]RWF24292.1 MAG: DUF982 domain-containing protein [Mesorhizobium sp.]TGT57706.1 DUF982 domain-containing protein [Mesorhizobium sp. M00.F.Ca.ET.170.01.1.1]